MLNLIKKERDALDRCYQSFFHDILIRSYKRGMEFYMQILVDWMNGNELDADLFYEVCFCIMNFNQMFILVLYLGHEQATLQQCFGAAEVIDCWI